MFCFRKSGRGELSGCFREGQLGGVLLIGIAGFFPGVKCLPLGGIVTRTPGLGGDIYPLVLRAKSSCSGDSK